MAKKTKKRTNKKHPSGGSAKAAPAESRLLWLLAAIAGASALWSAFQWNELLTLRSGGEIFCALGESGSCAALADSGFAVAVQQLSGLPVAGWGLVWSGAALALPIGALLRRSADGMDEPFWSATLLTALAGVVSIGVLVAVSISEGGFCSNCVITYAIVAAYAAVCWLRRSRAPTTRLEPGSGAGIATLATGIGFIALIYPGLQTPLPPEQQAEETMSKALASHAGHDHSSHSDASSFDPRMAQSGNLEELVASMNPEMQQALADSLAIYTASSADGSRAPRAVYGSPNAPVLITDFTDTLCGHCASLHATLAGMYSQLPKGSFAIDSRHFPLDGNCNPNVQHRHEDPVRCVSAAAQICMEDNGKAFQFAGSLYANQRDLDADMVYELASLYVDRQELEACIAAPETQAKLQTDIAWALEHDIRGTPLVLVNGRRATSFGPFLYAMISTEGESKHAAFDLLPPPSPPSR